ncbi:hypothetical protein Lal_00032175 [Lupinus albus]|nr:hypothetical protein Lal_00032175 [Lupinus albus]
MSNRGNIKKESVGKQNVWQPMHDHLKIEYKSFSMNMDCQLDQIKKSAKSSYFCPIVYSNWKAVPDKDFIWAYVKKKYITPDIWKNYAAQCNINKEHFRKYKTTRERLKNHPKDILESHFKELIHYWSLRKIQKISEHNSTNKAHQKWRHRTGPVNIVIIRERLISYFNYKINYLNYLAVQLRRIKRRSTKRKCYVKIDKTRKDSHWTKEQLTLYLRYLVKELCHGRVKTPTLLKRKEEIVALEKKHVDEIKLLNDKVEEMETKHKNEMSSMEQKFQILLRNVINQNNSGLDVEALAAMLSTPNTSTLTHVPNNDKENHFENNLPHTGDGEGNL